MAKLGALFMMSLTSGIINADNLNSEDVVTREANKRCGGHSEGDPTSAYVRFTHQLEANHGLG